MNSTFILVKSCWSNVKRRVACRNTWLSSLDRNWADYAFVVGAHAPLRFYASQTETLFGEDDVQAYLADDAFKCIGQKLQLAFRDLIQKEYERVVVVDDDTYVLLARLKKRVELTTNHDYVGFLREDAGCLGKIRYMQGSAYILGREAMRILAGAEEMRRQPRPDDVAVGEALEYFNINFLHDERFDPGPVAVPSIAETSLFTTHKVNPQQMMKMHERVLLRTELGDDI